MRRFYMCSCWGSLSIRCASRCTGALISFFFFNDTATTEIYTLSLHDALPILRKFFKLLRGHDEIVDENDRKNRKKDIDRKSTRLNSSHGYISYAVFCLKKKKTTTRVTRFATQRNHAKRKKQPAAV